jgi:hypothetical protein
MKAEIVKTETYVSDEFILRDVNVDNVSHTFKIKSVNSRFLSMCFARLGSDDFYCPIVNGKMIFERKVKSRWDEEESYWEYLVIRKSDNEIMWTKDYPNEKEYVRLEIDFGGITK